MNQKKLWGSLLAGFGVILYYGILLGLFVNAEMTTRDIPLLLFLFLIVVISIPIVAVGAVLIMRVREIKNGEEEEAKKY